MSKLADLQVRVDRLISGEKNVDDLSRLFLFLRERTRGDADLVRDIGDFEAHRDYREKGVTWTYALDYCSMMDRLYAPTHPPFVLTKEVLGRALSAAARSINRDKLEALTGFSARKDQHQLDAIVSRITKKIDRVENNEAVFAPGTLKQIERSIFDAIKEQKAIPVVLTQEGLAQQFGDLLVKEGFIEEVQLEKVHDQSEFLSLFAISRMHQAAIKLRNGKRAWLRAGISSFDPPFLDVKLLYAIDDQLHPATRVFSTKIVAMDNIDMGPLVKKYPDGYSEHMWDAPIDLANDGKLTPMTDKLVDWGDLGTTPSPV